MIPRYSMPEMAAVFADETRFGLWLEIELLAVEAWSELGVVPAEHARACRSRAPRIDADFVRRVAGREAVTNHDVAAFVDVVQESIGPPEGSWIHYGLTSSDVTDTALSATLVRSAGLLLEAADGLVSVLKRRARELADVPIVGRTHGMHAEPTTFGVKLALACLQADRDRDRLVHAREAVRVGKLSGAVGTYSNIDPYVERYVCDALGLQPVPATQVIARDRHAEYLYVCAALGTTVETIATEIRHLQRTEVAEVEEPFAAGQKGSSAMPHKRNPVVAERLTGLARVLRGYLIAGLEDVALWHERDISHSSVERIVLPDASMVAYYCARTLTRVIDGLVVNADADAREPPRRLTRPGLLPAGPAGAHRVRTHPGGRVPNRATRRAAGPRKEPALPRGSRTGPGSFRRSRRNGRSSRLARRGFRPGAVPGSRERHLCRSGERTRRDAGLTPATPGCRD